MLKNVERFSGLLPFRYQHARVQVELERQEPPPRIVRARYTLRIVTDEPQHRLELCTTTSCASARSPTPSPPPASSKERSSPSRPQPPNRSSHEHPGTTTSDPCSRSTRRQGPAQLSSRLVRRGDGHRHRRRHRLPQSRRHRRAAPHRAHGRRGIRAARLGPRDRDRDPISCSACPLPRRGPGGLAPPDHRRAVRHCSRPRSWCSRSPAPTVAARSFPRTRSW